MRHPRMPWTKRLNDYDASIREAQMAAAHAEYQTELIRRQWPLVRTTSEFLDVQLEKNHVAERFQKAFDLKQR